MDAKNLSVIFLIIYSLTSAVSERLVDVVFPSSEETSSEGGADDGEAWDGIRTRLLFPRNFLSVRINQFREKELRIGYNRVLFMETSVESEFMPGLDMVIRQVTDGHRLVQAVLQGGHLKECDFSKDTHQVLDFVASFAESAFPSNQHTFGNVFEAYSYQNTSLMQNVTLAFQQFDGIEFLGDFANLVDVRGLRKKCKMFYHMASQTAKLEAKTGDFSDIYAEVEKNELVDSDEQKRLSDAILSHSDVTKETSSMHKLTKRSTEPLKRSRSKRGSFDFNSVLIFPGTKWCGKGDLAKCYEDLGDDKELDSCCRDHDCCPYIIPPFTSRFNMFNYRFHSLLHCDCDQRFRGCLRKSESTMANMIGKIYFNILGSKCFDFQETEVCVDRAWWGGCRKYETQATGVLKTQVSFCEDAEKLALLKTTMKPDITDKVQKKPDITDKVKTKPFRSVENETRRKQYS